MLLFCLTGPRHLWFRPGSAPAEDQRVQGATLVQDRTPAEGQHAQTRSKRSDNPPPFALFPLFDGRFLCSPGAKCLCGEERHLRPPGVRRGDLGQGADSLQELQPDGAGHSRAEGGAGHGASGKHQEPLWVSAGAALANNFNSWCIFYFIYLFIFGSIATLLTCSTCWS